MKESKKGADKKCVKKGCKNEATTLKFCRLHYIASSEQKYKKGLVAKEKMLESYMKAITKRYPDRYLEIIKKDLSSPESFKKTIKELDIDQDITLDDFNEPDDMVEKFKKG